MVPLIFINNLSTNLKTPTYAYIVSCVAERNVSMEESMITQLLPGSRSIPFSASTISQLKDVFSIAHTPLWKDLTRLQLPSWALKTVIICSHLLQSITTSPKWMSQQDFMVFMRDEWSEWSPNDDGFRSLWNECSSIPSHQGGVCPFDQWD